MKKYPTFEKHENAICFECNNSLNLDFDKPINYGFADGKYGIWCNKCCMRTYYDTPDQSIKFDKKGDKITPSCPCGCITEYSQWPTNESGYKECPDCKMV